MSRWPWIVGGAIAAYALVHKSRARAPITSDAAKSSTLSSAARNGGLVYRHIGGRGDPYPQWVRDLRGAAGVYVIREAGETVYVGSSRTQLYDTLTRHFQSWRRWKGYWSGQFGEGHDPGLTYDREAVEVAVRVTQPSEALDEEMRLIKRLRPRDNVIGQVVDDEVPF